jgi:hypothetical protein
VSVAKESRNENFRPSVSATTPVGTWKSRSPTLNAALTRKTWKMVSPACRRKSVFTPQMMDVESVKRTLVTR